MTDPQWEVFSYEAVIAAAVLYFLAMLAYFFELASLRTASKEAEIVNSYMLPHGTGLGSAARPRATRAT